MAADQVIEVECTSLEVDKVDRVTKMLLKISLLVVALILSDCQGKPVPIQDASTKTKPTDEICLQSPLPPQCLDENGNKNENGNLEMDAEPVYTDNDSMELQITPFPHELPAEIKGRLTLIFTALKDTEGRDIEILLNNEAVSEVTISLSCGFLEDPPECNSLRTECRIYLEEMAKDDKCVFTLTVTASEDFDLDVRSCDDLGTTPSPICLQFGKKTDASLPPHILVTP